MGALWKVYSDSAVREPKLTEYWNLHNWGSDGTGNVLQIIVLLVYRF